MWDQAQAIVWAQWRSLRNFYPRSAAWGTVLFFFVNMLWYGLFALAGWAVYSLLSSRQMFPQFRMLLPAGFFLTFMYWQVVPVLMVATGTALDLKKLIVYPIPYRQLFAIETVLRLSTGGEVLIVLIAAMLGLWRNPLVPWWGPFAILAFIVFNLLLAVGTREVLGRLLARRKIREIAVLVLVMISALPQVLLIGGRDANSGQVMSIAQRLSSFLLPWGAVAQFASGESFLRAGAAMIAWIGIAWWFGWSQFDRSLRFDASAASATPHAGGASAGWGDRILRFPSTLFSDPLAALIEKELRFLMRAPRFRLVFIMGFTFGLLIWTPLVFGRGDRFRMNADSNFLLYVSLYSLLLLGEVCFWNAFGFDRTAAQAYFALPVPFRRVLMAKNLTALVFVLLEITMITLICSLFVKFAPLKILDAYAITLMISLYLMSIGNLTSVNFPRGVNPANSFRSSSVGKTQAVLLGGYLLCSIPVLLCFGARWALKSDLAFYGAAALCALVGLMLYYVAMDSALETALARREEIIATLSRGDGPMN
jgi:ABC-2 type transport system permease protein